MRSRNGCEDALVAQAGRCSAVAMSLLFRLSAADWDGALVLLDVLAC